jgi:deoxyribose-phosphate aldolase
MTDPHRTMCLSRPAPLQDVIRLGKAACIGAGAAAGFVIMAEFSEQDVARIVEEVVMRVQAASQGAKGSCGCKDAESAPVKTPPKVAPEERPHRMGLDDNQSLECGDLAPLIDHTLLKPEATEDDVKKICREALKHQFASVCVNTAHVELCAQMLAGSNVRVCCVVGFPLGAMSSDSKAFETRDAVRRGAEEIDMVNNVGLLRSGDYARVYEDVRAVVQAAAGRPVKVILETSLLNEDQKIAACVLSKAAGADFVKTSTGFGGGGATAEDIALMRRIVGPEMGVKASGGIRDCNIAAQMVASGATRLGASASIAIVKGQESKSSY